MKTRIIPIVLAGFLLALAAGWIEAAPAPVIVGQPKVLTSFKAYFGEVPCLAFSPDGKTVATGGYGERLPTGGHMGRVKLWEAATGKNLVDIPAHQPDARRGGRGRVRCVAFSPDGKTLASSGDARKINGKIKLWEVATGKNMDCIEVNVGPPMLFSRDGKTLICGNSRIDLATKRERPLIENLKGAPPTLCSDRKGNLLVGTTLSYPDPISLVLWDVKTGKRKLTCEGTRRVFECAAFDPDGKTVVSIDGDYREGERWAIRLWDVATGKNTATLEQPEIPCEAVFSPNGKVLAVNYRHSGRRTDPSRIRLLDMPSGKVLATLKGDGWFNSCMAFSPNGCLLAIGGAYGVVTIWRLPDRYKPE